MPKGNFDDTEKVQKIIGRLLKLPRISIQTARNLELLKRQLEGEMEALKEQDPSGLKWPRNSDLVKGNTSIPRRPYASPEVRKFERVEDLPSVQQDIAKQLLEEVADMAMILDRDRRWVSVTRSFAQLIGYRTMDLIGRKVDDFTVENSIDIKFAFKVLAEMGEMDGMWMFRHRDGHKVLVHYHARLNSGLSHAELKPLLVA